MEERVYRTGAELEAAIRACVAQVAELVVQEALSLDINPDEVMAGLYDADTVVTMIEMVLDELNVGRHAAALVAHLESLHQCEHQS